MKEVSAQEIFNKIVTHLRKQGKPAMEKPYGTCFYRTAEGLQCAVGCLIPDSVYSPKMEYTAASGMIPLYPELSNLIPHIDLLEDMQNVHDIRSPDAWEGYWKEIAQIHGLVYTPPA